jgi:hypothetical protein
VVKQGSMIAPYLIRIIECDHVHLNVRTLYGRALCRLGPIRSFNGLPTRMAGGVAVGSIGGRN